MKQIKAIIEKYGWVLALIGIIPDVWFGYELIEMIKHNVKHIYLIGISGVLSGISIVVFLYWLLYIIYLRINKKKQKLNNLMKTIEIMKSKPIEEDFSCKEVLNLGSMFKTARDKAFHFGNYLAKIEVWSDEIKELNKEDINKIKAQYSFWREQEKADAL